MSWRKIQKAKKHALRRFKLFHGFDPSARHSNRFLTEWTIQSLLGHYRKTGNSQSEPKGYFTRRKQSFKEIITQREIEEWFNDCGDNR